MEFELNGEEYKLSKIDTISQFHLVRKLAPIFGELAALNGEQKDDAIAKLTGAVAKLSNEDAEYCLYGLLKAVSKKQKSGMGYAAIVSNNVLMYQDIDLQTMMQLAFKSLQHSLANFFQNAP